jgi:hypothetical protein
MLKKTGWIAALVMASAFALGACGKKEEGAGGGAAAKGTCESTAKAVAKIEGGGDKAKEDEAYNDIKGDCERQKWPQETLDCATKAATKEDLDKCPKPK